MDLLEQCIEKFSNADTWEAFDKILAESKDFIESDLPGRVDA